MASPSIKSGLGDLIREGLKLQYISESCHDAIRTGNHYQSIALGEERTSGFRTPRTEFLDMVRFEGKRVLDLGSNLGEISRAVRDRGATLVDGVEYDPFFVELAQAVNARNGVSRVSFYRGDITDPATYRETYDVVLGLSVFIYMQFVLPRIADVTSELLIVETHKLTGNLEETYLAPISQYFPYHVLLGESDWGTSVSSDETRAVVAFARDRAALLRGLTVPVRPRTFVRKSDSGGYVTSVDCARTPWCDRFFSMFRSGTALELLDSFRLMDIDIAPLAVCSDLLSHVMSGWAYWFLYVKGYLQWRDQNEVTDDNIYVRYMRDVYPRGNHDEALVAQLLEEDAKARLGLRFHDFHAILTGEQVDPVSLVIREEPPEDGKVLYEHPSGRPLAVALVDGYHRLFAARLCCVEAIPAQVMFE